MTRANLIDIANRFDVYTDLRTGIRYDCATDATGHHKYPAHEKTHKDTDNFLVTVGAWLNT
jgi:hypothetical protein